MGEEPQAEEKEQRGKDHDAQEGSCMTPLEKPQRAVCPSREQEGATCPPGA